MRHPDGTDKLLGLARIILAEHSVRPREGKLTKKAHLYSWTQAINTAYVNTQLAIPAEDGKLAFTSPDDEAHYNSILTVLPTLDSHAARFALMHTALSFGERSYDTHETGREHHNPDPEVVFSRALEDAQNGNYTLSPEGDAFISL